MTLKEWMVGTAALVAGIAVTETAITSVAPYEVDWPWFHTIGFGAICLAAGVMGFIEPRHAWRWGILPIAAIPAWIAFRSGTLGPMWPLFLMAFMSLAIPPMIAGWIGAWLRRRSDA